MKIFRKMIPVFLQLMLVLAAVPAWSADFTQADLEKMVKELDTVIPRNPNFAYPIACSVVEKDEVNAYATVRKEEGQSKPRATMVVFSGLLKGIGGDIRLVRAVVAHELSHLSAGHLIGVNPKARDLKNLWVRQQEFEADKLGAMALQAAGYSKQDMVDMLLFLDKNEGREGEWLGRLLADHADPKARAAEVSSNPDVLRSLVLFDTALAYFDSRRFYQAGRMFDEVAVKQPNMPEAFINAGRSYLMMYYDFLPGGVRDNTWWRPDFGPILTEIKAGERDPLIRDEDRERYKDAIERINAAVAKAPNDKRAQELLAIAQVLEPDGKVDVVQKGITWFKSALSASSNDREQLRFANNAALGMQRLGDEKTGYDLMLKTQSGTKSYNAALAENVGRAKVTPGGDNANLAAVLMLTWLSDTPTISPNYENVKKTYYDVCSKASLKAVDPEHKPTYLCKVVSMFIGGKEMGVLMPRKAYVDTFGVPDLTVSFTDQYPDLNELRWKGGNLSAWSERDGILRVTSYEPGSYLLLKPSEKTVTGVWKVSVGMTAEDLAKILNEKAGVQKDLANGGKTEVWTYYPSLNFGVLMENGKVKALTVTPVVYEG